MDISPSIVPNSTQLNADDLMAGPVTVTIESVTKGTLEQPVNVNLKEFPGRAYRPSKSMRRVMVVAWGAEASEYEGHQLTLYRNPEIVFGGKAVGGIEISHMSHISAPIKVALTTTRGKRKDFTVLPADSDVRVVYAKEAPPVQDPVLVNEWLETIRDASTLAQLEAAWHGINAAGIAKDPRIIAAKNARKAELNAA